MRIFIAFIFVFSTWFHTQSQVTITSGEKANQLVLVLKDRHLQPPKIDSTFGAIVHQFFLETIDPDHLFFTSKDIETLQPSIALIHEDLKSKKENYFGEVSRRYKENLAKIEPIVMKQLDNPNLIQEVTEKLDFETYDDWETTQLKWKADVRIDLIRTMLNSVDEYAVLLNVDSLKNIQAKSLTKLKDIYKDYFINLKTENDHFLEDSYLNAIAMTFDPHSNYFSKSKNRQFSQELVSEREMFGFDCAKLMNGSFEIDNIVPGSAAWMSGNIQKGDLINAVQFGDEAEILMSGLTYYQFTQLFDNAEAKELKLTLQKKNGEVMTVELVKSKVFTDGDNIKTAVLRGEKNIGYISLPDFYMNWTDTSTVGCANDVAKSIIKLKKQAFDGLIIDLRNNGGGSLKEAIDLVGIFIDYGPVLVQSTKGGDLFTAKDFNRGSIYYGPLVIMINENSASASEVVAGTLQDYNRAVIVGQRSYGKATGQGVLAIDPISYSLGGFENQDWGYAKITQLGLYRITLGTNQKFGVTPDVLLENPFAYSSDREEDYPTVITLPTIEKKVYFTPNTTTVDKNKLQAISQSRYTTNESFQQLTALFNELNEVGDNIDVQTQTISEIVDYKIQLEKIGAQIDSLYEMRSNSFDAVSLNHESELYEMNSQMSKFQEKFLNQINQDMELEETYHIITDIITKN